LGKIPQFPRYGGGGFQLQLLPGNFLPAADCHLDLLPCDHQWCPVSLDSLLALVPPANSFTIEQDQKPLFTSRFLEALDRLLLPAAGQP
jgi:hypothetical protein